jgi:hypothetical protein
MGSLAATASALVAPPKGILATPPGGAVMSGRLAAAGVPPMEGRYTPERDLDAA